MTVVPPLRDRPAEAFAIVIVMFVTAVAMVAALLDPTRRSDDTMMLPVLFATGASFLVAQLVYLQRSDSALDPGSPPSTRFIVLVYGGIMIPSVALAFWWAWLRYNRSQD